MQKVFILGIGNPEEKYNNTRHNIGKDWVEKIAKDHELTFVKKSKLKCSICEVEPHVYLVAPDVYVNEIGKVASEAAGTGTTQPGPQQVSREGRRQAPLQPFLG